MNRDNFNRLYLIIIISFITGCKSSIKEQSDKIYSRHLQRHVNLTIISTSMPDEKSDMNLLLFNNGNELEQMHVKKIIDSLSRKKLIQPLIVVGIHGNENEDYGLGILSDSAYSGGKAGKYNSFVINELYPFIKKKAVIRKFNSIVIYGNSQGGISAFDIAWQNADKIDRVGIFSANFNYANPDTPPDNPSRNTVLENIMSSRKRPKLQYWFYAAEKNEDGILDDTKELINIIGKKNTGSKADIQFITDKTGSNDISSWRHHFAEFLVWAFPK